MTVPQPLILLNPGPVTLTARVRAALTRGDWCHREPEFAELVRGINRDLATVYPTLNGAYESVLLTGSGTAAVEGMLASFAPTQATTLVIANGVYGERMVRMLTAHRRPHRVLAHDWVEAVNVPALERVLEDDPAITHVAVVHHETTTGRLNDLHAIGKVCRARGRKLLVDAVSSFGAERIESEAWNLAGLAGTANKCLHGAPGLSFVLAHRDLWGTPPERPSSVYFDLHACHRAQHGDGYSPFTQAVQIAFALREALDEYRDQGGWRDRHDLYRERAERIASVLTGLGVQPLLEPADYSVVLRSWRLSPGLTYATLHDALRQRGFVIYAGQGHLASSLFRIAHMGAIGNDDLERLCAALRAIIGERA